MYFSAPKGESASMFIEPIRDGELRLRYDLAGEAPGSEYQHETQLEVGQQFYPKQRISRCELLLLQEGSVVVKWQLK